LALLLGSLRDVLVNSVISNICGLLFSRRHYEIKGTRTKRVLQ